jgi:hypothetical protein
MVGPVMHRVVMVTIMMMITMMAMVPVMMHRSSRSDVRLFDRRRCRGSHRRRRRRRGCRRRRAGARGEQRQSGNNKERLS